MKFVFFSKEIHVDDQSSTKCISKKPCLNLVSEDINQSQVNSELFATIIYIYMLKEFIFGGK